MNTSDIRRPTLMIVHAHPDDEASQTGGTFARYAAAGYRTVLVTCTNGAQGDEGSGIKPGHMDHDSERVAARRSYELSMSKVALGISDVVELGYPDSGMPETSDDIASAAFSKLDGEPIVQQLEDLMHQYAPDVIVTYPPNGLSYHPDHIRTHQLTMAAFDRFTSSAEGAATAGSAAPRLPKLYYIALSVSRLKAVQVRAEAELGPGTWAPPLEIGVADDTITTSVDVSEFWSAKLRALAAHASQADAAGLVQVLGIPGHTSFVEEYIRVRPQWDGSRRENDLFAGVDGSGPTS
ncbi:PIG-L family deacetylase [Streptomyces sp. SAS_275]|uniref:PIG-L family deacetylase n=1 Tax=Streptomyces sp. SAS_275 TaxID=3412746 RepID=UPI00403D5256